MNYFEELTEKAKEGFESPLKAYIELKKEIDRLTKLQESIKMDAIQEAANEPEPFERFGANITYLNSAGSRWDFKGIPEWVELDNQRKELEDKHKKAYQMWKRGGSYIDNETGEVVTPAAYKDGNSAIRISIKNGKK